MRLLLILSVGIMVYSRWEIPAQQYQERRAEVPSESPKVIVQCANGHYSIGQECSHCDAPIVKTLEFRDLDCVACGALCSVVAYCCDSKDPVRAEDYERVYLTNVSLSKAVRHH
jgi:hypothetical protein